MISLDFGYLLRVPRVPVDFNFSLGEVFLSQKLSLSQILAAFARKCGFFGPVVHYLIPHSNLKLSNYLQICVKIKQNEFIKWSVFKTR